MSAIARDAVFKRVAGERVSAVQAGLAAAVAGAAAAVLTYRVLRS